MAQVVPVDDQPFDFVRYAATLGVIGMQVWGILQFNGWPYGRVLYNSPKCWQVTILTMHVSTVVSIRITFGALLDTWFPGLALQYSLACIWVAASIVLRWPLSSCSVAIAALEVLACGVPINATTLHVLTTQNLLIPPVFWLGMFIVCLNFAPSFSFVPLDQHLRKGMAHMLKARDAQFSLLSNVLLHFVHQACSVLAIAGQASVAALRTCLIINSVYWFIVCSVDRITGWGRPYPIPSVAGMFIGTLCCLTELVLWSMRS